MNSAQKLNAVIKILSLIHISRSSLEREENKPATPFRVVPGMGEKLGARGSPLLRSALAAMPLPCQLYCSKVPMPAVTFISNEPYFFDKEVPK